MGDVYDFFSKKKVNQPRSSKLSERYIQCLERASEIGFCDCQLCTDKLILSERLYAIVKYLCKDYKQKTGHELYIADAFEMLLIVVARLKNELID